MIIRNALRSISGTPCKTGAYNEDAGCWSFFRIVRLAFLLLFYDLPSNIPVCSKHFCICSTIDFVSCIFKYLSDLLKKTVIVKRWLASHIPNCLDLKKWHWYRIYGMRSPSISYVVFSNDFATYGTHIETPFSRCIATQKECIHEFFIKTF